MLFSRVFGLASLAIAVSAQGEYYIDPSTVPIETKEVWCNNQRSSCPLLCTQFPGGSMTTAANDCEPENLIYHCVCENGLSPNMSEYSLTIPYHTCIQWGQNCIASCGTNTCQAACTEQHPCGAQNPSKVNATTTTTSSTSHATDGADAEESGPVVHNGFGSDASSTTEESSPVSTNAAQAALDIGKTYGLSIVFTGIFAVFGFVM